jgi:Ca2+-binding EF-hand superfamily protein
LIYERGNKPNGRNVDGSFDQKRYFDPDHNELLGKSELQQGFRTLGFQMNRKEVDDLVQRYDYDADNDTCLSLDDFKRPVMID